MVGSVRCISLTMMLLETERMVRIGGKRSRDLGDRARRRLGDY